MHPFAVNTHWPDEPYRGLNYFRPQDRPLLAGRDNDVDICTTLLGHPETRVLLLHGATGCGKSSFLRAGLIPTMEESGAGYLFIKTPQGDDEAQFIRSTNAPISQIAYHIYNFAKAPFETRTPKGLRTLDLTAALLGSTSWEDFLSRAGDPEHLIQSLQMIAKIIPQPLVLIIDQAEEVLTLNPGDAGKDNRARFFSFLRFFQELKINARIVVTLRTEYFGRFADASQSGYQATAHFQHFFLPDLQTEALLEAIMRPTEQEKDNWYGRPPYGFSFEDGLPQKIVNDLTKAGQSGPTLPILQLVCLGLYRDCVGRQETLITAKDYATKGKVEGQLVEHVKGATITLYDASTDVAENIPAIMSFLSSFYMLQEDGTVVARTQSIEWAKSEIQRRLNLDPDVLLGLLANPQIMVLRRLRNVNSQGRVVDEVTLGHDAVALAIEHWNAKEAQSRARKAEAAHGRALNELRQYSLITSRQRTLFGKLLGRYSAIHRFFRFTAIANMVVVFIIFVWALFAQLLPASVENGSELRLDGFFYHADFFASSLFYFLLIFPAVFSIASAVIQARDFRRKVRIMEEWEFLQTGKDKTAEDSENRIGTIEEWGDD